MPPIPPLPQIVSPSPDPPSKKPIGDPDEDEVAIVVLQSAPIVLKAGTFLVCYYPSNNTSDTYDGTLRVKYVDGTNASSSRRSASGDLYERRGSAVKIPLISGDTPKPQDGIPVLSLTQYRHYLCVTSLFNGKRLTQSGRITPITMSFDRWSYTPGKTKVSDGSWSNDGGFSAALSPATTFNGSKFQDAFAGPVNDASGKSVGKIELVWVSNSYRKVSLEIATVSGVPRPEQNGVGDNWRSLFAVAGIDLNVILGKTDVPEPPNGKGTWTLSDLRSGMQTARTSVDFDKEIRYFLLVVKKIEGVPRGTMADLGPTDSNKITRGGAVVATEWVTPSGWGTVSQKSWGSLTGPLFRTAVHEIGHAMNLTHSTEKTQTFMDTSEDIVSAGEKSGVTAFKFPNNIKWSFADENIRCLQHWPDVHIRPGGSLFDGKLDSAC